MNNVNNKMLAKSISSWLGLTLFEIWVNMACFIIFTILLTIKLHFPLSMAWSRVFIPLFLSSLLTAYLTIIICVRSIFLKRFPWKCIVMKLISTTCLTTTLFLFFHLICIKISTTADISFHLIFIPIYAIFAILMLRVCLCAK